MDWASWMTHTLTGIVGVVTATIGAYYFYRTKSTEVRKAEEAIDAKAEERERKAGEKNQEFIDRRMRDFVDHMQGKYQALYDEMKEKYDELAKDTAKLKDDHSQCQEDHAVAMANNQYMKDMVEEKSRRISDLTMEVGLLRSRLESIEERRNGGGL